MDLLEHQAILGRLQRKHRKAQEEAAALRAQVAEFQSTPPPSEFYSPPGKAAHGRRVFVGAESTCLATGTPLSSPASGATNPPPPSAVDFWVALEASRARHDKAEVKRRKQEERTRLAGVLSACGWDKETADPELLRAAKGFWVGTETQGNAGQDRGWGKEQRYLAVKGPCVPAHCTAFCVFPHCTAFCVFPYCAACVYSRTVLFI